MGALAFFCVLTIFSSMVPAETISIDESEIRRARDVSNQALLNKDAELLVTTLRPDYHVVTSTNLQLSGHDDQREMMARIASKYPDAVYVRTPLTIEINLSASSAAETGTWKGTWTEAGKMLELQGSYYAKWTKSADGWLIQAEIFVIL